MCWRNNLEKVLVVESKNLARNSLDTRVNQVESILSGVDVANDPVVDIDESVLSFLDRSKHAIEQLSLVHLVASQTNFGLSEAA